MKIVLFIFNFLITVVRIYYQASSIQPKKKYEKFEKMFKTIPSSKNSVRRLLNSGIISLSFVNYLNDNIAETIFATIVVTITFLLYFPSSSFTTSLIMPVILNIAIIYQVDLTVSMLKIGIISEVLVNIMKKF